MSETLIDIRKLDAHYGDVQVLNDVSFTVEKGEIFVIIGGSGCGKSTLLKHLCGLITPTDGEIIYQGQDIANLDETQLAKVQQTFGIAFQSSGLFNSMSVGNNVAMPLREYGKVSERLIDPIVRAKLGLVGLSAAQHKLPSELSGGMRKRAGLARAIAADPPLVFFDEPSAGLDPIMAAGLDELILNLNKDLGITFVIVTHEVDSIRKVADRILMLDQGHVIFCGTMEEVDHTDNDRVRQFFERRPDEFIAQRNL